MKRSIKQRIAAASSDDVEQKCMIPGCGRLSTRSAGVGLSSFSCRYHLQRKARHGSPWHASYSAAELQPFLKAASAWIAAHRTDHMFVAAVIEELQGVLDTSGHAEIATRLRGLSAKSRGRIALARLRDANVSPERLFAIYLAVCSLIEEDRGSHRTYEFTIVQLAKACHRLASGYHRRWELPLADGRVAVAIIHAYPRSSGRVLRVIGEAINKACEVAAQEHLAAVLALKVERFGPHASTLSGWIPEWKRQLLEARCRQTGSLG